MEQKIETTIVYWGYMRIMEKETEKTIRSCATELAIPISPGPKLSASLHRYNRFSSASIRVFGPRPLIREVFTREQENRKSSRVIYNPYNPCSFHFLFHYLNIAPI